MTPRSKNQLRSHLVAGLALLTLSRLFFRRVQQPFQTNYHTLIHLTDRQAQGPVKQDSLASTLSLPEPVAS